MYKNRVEDVKFFVVEPKVESVLSGNICVKLGLLKRVHQLTSNPSLAGTTVELEDYPELFSGLGCLPGTYHIELPLLRLWYILQGRYRYLRERKLLKN